MSMFLKNSIMNPPKSGNFFICDMTAKRLICWFSCGAASAVATYLALKENRQTKQFNEVKVVYTHVQEEHPDNYRFFCDCEKWFKQNIEILENQKYRGSIVRVFDSLQYMGGGAWCTMYSAS